MSWYLAHNLVVIGDSIHVQLGPVTIYSLGDAKHKAEVSDHNPDGKGCVHAIDVMFPVGPKASAVVRAAVGRWDLKYVIHNRTIWEAKNGWKARAYKGSDPHTNHVHISGVYSAAAEGNSQPLTINGSATVVPIVVHSTAPRWRFPGTTKLGSQGVAVRAVQQRMHDRGWAIGQGSRKYGTIDGFFGPKMKSMVLAFQREKHILADGIVGPNTWLHMCNDPL
jgi:peptidoglycan hydrolase-like protein with peptidoglycan-binding domain